MAAHEEDDKLHLRMAMDTTVKLEEDVAEFKSITVKKLENELAALRAQMNGEPLEFIFTDYRKRKAKKRACAVSLLLHFP